MPWQPGDRDAIFGALDLTYSDLMIKRVDQAMATLETYGGEAAISRVQGYLFDLEDYDSAIVTGAGEAGLKRADVIEWFAPGAATSGYTTLKGDRKRKIASALGLSWAIPGSGTLLRS